MSTLEPADAFKIRLAEAQKVHRKEHARLLKQVNHRKEALEQALGWPAVHHEGLLLQANLFQIQPKIKSIDVVDWEQPEGAPLRTIVLDGKMTPTKQVEGYFRKSRKLRTAVPHAKRLLEEAEKRVLESERRGNQLEVCDSLESLEALQENFQTRIQKKSIPKKSEVNLPKRPYKCFISSSGVEIWAGKSAKENDQLSFHYASGSDWWMHANGCSGSHVVIRVPKGCIPDEATLHDAAEVALRMSQAKNAASGEVTVTQVKWLKSVRGCPGKVMVSQYKVLHHHLNNDRWKELSLPPRL